MCSAAGRLAVEPSVIDQPRRLVLTNAYDCRLRGFLVHELLRVARLGRAGGRVTGSAYEIVQRMVREVVMGALR